MSIETDWEGNVIPSDETPDTIIRVWNIDPSPNHDFDILVTRSWQQCLDAIASTAECTLDGRDELPTSRDPFTIKVWSSKMRKADYDALTETDE